MSGLHPRAMLQPMPQVAEIVSCPIVAMLGLAYKEGLMTPVESTELDDAVDAIVVE